MEKQAKKKLGTDKKQETEEDKKKKKRPESRATRFVRGAAKYARAASVAFGALLSIVEALRSHD